MNPALLQKGSNSFRTDSEIKDHEGANQHDSRGGSRISGKGVHLYNGVGSLLC